MKLQALQHDFRDWLSAASRDAGTRLAGGEDAPGLAVYQNNYRAQLVGCLQQTYPCLRRFIGDEAFLCAAVAHIERCPPSAWTLDAYGEHFGATLAGLYPDNPNLHELAWIEWAANTAFVAADSRALDLATLGAVDWDSARLLFAPSLRLAPLSTNAVELWAALNEGSEAPESSMLEEGAAMLVWRPGLKVRIRVLEYGDYEALQQARRHASFAALCGMLVDRLGEAAGVAAGGALLADWIGSEIVVGLDGGAHGA
jgi:hypothetical protein